jgi:hypothetical protein
MPASTAPVKAQNADLLLKAGGVYLGSWSPTDLPGDWHSRGGFQQEVELGFLIERARCPARAVPGPC